MDADVVIVGAGVAGASLAHFLTQAGVRRVLVIEREDRPAYHASGRSAEALVEVELDPLWQALVLEGARFLRQPPPTVARASLLRETGVVNLLDEGERAELEAALPDLHHRGVTAEILEPADLRARFPHLTETDLAGAVHLPRSGRVAVSALIAGYLGAARSRGAELWLDAELYAVDTEGGRVSGVQTSRGEVRCQWVVNAAGAWAGIVARLADATPIAIAPLRRTVVTFDPPAGVEVAGWPLLSYDSRGIYLAPEGRSLIASPMDEDPVEPCDARPVPEAVRLALDRLERLAAPLRPPAVRAVRAGLRSFAPDRRPLVGEDPALPGFVWLAGQGGRGIETSPALGRLAAEVITRGGVADRELAAALAPSRLTGQVLEASPAGA